jgi:hypothetical protein
VCCVPRRLDHQRYSNLLCLPDANRGKSIRPHNARLRNILGPPHLVRLHSSSYLDLLPLNFTLSSFYFQASFLPGCRRPIATQHTKHPTAAEYHRRIRALTLTLILDWYLDNCVFQRQLSLWTGPCSYRAPFFLRRPSTTVVIVITDHYRLSRIDQLAPLMHSSHAKSSILPLSCLHRRPHVEVNCSNTSRSTSGSTQRSFRLPVSFPLYPSAKL